MPQKESNSDKIKRLDKEIYGHFEKMNDDSPDVEKEALSDEDYLHQIKRLEDELKEKINQMSADERESFERESRKFRQENDE